MPQYFSHLAREQERLAQILPDGTVHWEAAHMATAFATAAEARAKTLAAIRATFDACVCEPKESCLDQLRRGGLGSGFNGPAWLRTWVGHDMEADRPVFAPALDELIVVAKSTEADLLAPFDSFHVRSEWGWLACRGGALCDWVPSFNDSKSFASIEDAESAAALAEGPGGHAVFRVRSQIEQAAVTGQPGAEARALAASCEARQIEAEASPAASAPPPRL